jgi:putative PIG3 family NAD(P)H quinone oxidoreductase
MKAIVYAGAGDAGVIQLKDAPTPEPGAGQIRVRVHASALNRADILQRKGRYPAPPGWPADIPGLEYAGEVELLGAGVTRWHVGDRVMGLVGGGGHAEYVVVNADEGIAIPAGMDLAEAAAIPEAFLTAWDALTARGRLQGGERVLIHAVGSGVGTAAVQLAKRLGAVTAGTSRSAGKLEQVRGLGLDEAIDTSAGGFRAKLAAPVDVILDVLGGPAFAENLDALNPRGRMVMLGFLQGAAIPAGADHGRPLLEPILRKRLEIIGSVMRSRPAAERAAVAGDFAARVIPWLEGAAPPVRPVIGARYPMAAIAEAHAAMEADRVLGKIVMTW